MAESRLKKFKITERMPVPAHPRCRCCIIPVVDTSNKKMELNIQLFAQKSEASLKGKTNLSISSNTVLTEEGLLVTAYSKDDFDETIKEILKELQSNGI